VSQTNNININRRTRRKEERKPRRENMSVYVITGANRGIGKAIVDRLGRHLSNKNSEEDSVVYLTSRKAEDGEAAVKELGLPNVRPVVLDVADQQSVDNFVKLLKENHPSGIDVLINNAGYVYPGSELDETIANATLWPNYYGPKQLTKALLPLLKPNGRIINLSSRHGQLQNYSEDLKQKFLAPGLTESELDGLVTK